MGRDPVATAMREMATTTIELDQPRNIGPNVLAVSTLPASDPQVPDWPNDWERIDEVLAASGISYDDYPDVPRDAAVRDGVAVIAAGNAEREAGMWYSTDGTWQRATVSLTPGMTIGESPGDHHIADGIQNVEAFSEGFVAWEQVQLVGAGDQLDFEGTLVLVSTDGADWTGAVYGEPDPNVRFTDFGEYGDGYLATLVFREGNHHRTELLWTPDLWSHPIDWHSVTPIGGGYAHELVVEGSTVFVLLEDFESGDSGGVSVVKVDLD